MDDKRGAEPSPARSRPRRLLRRGVQTLLVLLALSGAYLGVQQLIGNFHTVIAGELYRSAQLDAADIAGIESEHNIRTIINLRGAAPNKAWYRAEVAEAEKLGIQHVDFGLSASRELTDAQVTRLIEIMRAAPKPILIHCRAGADRTGIASAIYVAAIAKEGEMAAEWQLSPYYGHFPIPFTPSWAMDETFERIEPALGFHHS